MKTPADLLVMQIPRLRRYARALTGDAYRADDLVQDCLARALPRLRLWKPGADMRAWLGFDLVGGRLLPSTNRMAAQFMYQNAGGERITLYVRRVAWKNRQTAFQYQEAEGVSVFYWIDGPMGYALSGNLGKKRLIAIAEAAQDAFAGGV